MEKLKQYAILHVPVELSDLAHLSFKLQASSFVSQQVLQYGSPFHHARTRARALQLSAQSRRNFHLLHRPGLFHHNDILLASRLPWRCTVKHNVLLVTPSSL